MSRFTFICETDDVRNETTFEADLWTDALDNFKLFLRGAGYYFDDDFTLGTEARDAIKEEPEFDTKPLRDLKWIWYREAKKKDSSSF